MNISHFLDQYASHPNYKSPVGSKLNSKSWQTEAPLRMLLNNLDSEVAEDPNNLIVYGGSGQAARNRESLEKIIEILLDLEEDESLLIQSGKPVGKVRSHDQAPRVLIANSNLVPEWANWEHFEKLKSDGLMMYGQMTAGSWIYIGTQGILQGTYETFAACANKHFGGSLKGKLLVSGGLGGMGGAQPLAATMAGATFLGADIDSSRIEKRLKTKYIDKMTESYIEARDWVLDAKKNNKNISVGLVSDAGDMLDNLLEDGIIPEVLTDQTSAHDPVFGYVPNGMTLNQAQELRNSDQKKYKKISLKSMARHVSLMLRMQEMGSITFDYGNNLREFAKQGGEKNAFNFNGFVPDYIRPLFCEGKGPFRWVALSGDPEDIYKTDAKALELFPEDKLLARWIKMAQKKVQFQGLPARICWLGYRERNIFGEAINDMVKNGELKAPIVIGRDHLDCGSVASPNRETEAMKDGSDAVADWPVLNALLSTAGGSSWTSLHHGGGVGLGYSIHSGVVIVADGEEHTKERLNRVLTNDPGLGVARHVDAGYSKAIKTAKERNLDVPNIND